MRARVPLDRLQGHRRSRASPSTRTAARSATRPGACSTTSGDPGRGPVRVGWIKRGPSGVIGTNKKDAQETIDLLFEDLEAGRVPEPALADGTSIEELLRERSPDPRQLRGLGGDRRRREGRGEPLGRPRVKFCRIDEMLEAASACTSRTGQVLRAHASSRSDPELEDGVDQADLVFTDPLKLSTRKEGGLNVPRRPFG